MGIVWFDAVPLLLSDAWVVWPCKFLVVLKQQQQQQQSGERVSDPCSFGYALSFNGYKA
jgi:hypothetical protein